MPGPGCQYPTGQTGCAQGSVLIAFRSCFRGMTFKSSLTLLEMKQDFSHILIFTVGEERLEAFLVRGWHTRDLTEVEAVSGVDVVSLDLHFDSP
ncbi:MAG: hypothetical protein U0931_11735 [Vulcanimicrobiota bacterium]